MSEDLEQKQLLTWVKIQYPNLLYTEDMGGVKLTMGQAKKAKRSRCRKGHPDLMFQHTHRDLDDGILYVGLAIEFKRKGETVQNKNGTLRKKEHLSNQYEYLIALQEQGWFSCFAIGFSDAQRIIKTYMSNNIHDIDQMGQFTFPYN